MFFDIGGVLEITPSTGWPEVWAHRLGLSAEAFAAETRDLFAAGSVGGMGESDVRSELGRRLGLDAAAVEALMDDIWAEYLGSPNEELIAYAWALRSRCRVGLISNSFVGAREREQDYYRFSDLADAIVYSHEVGAAKPDPAIYRLACTRLNVAPSQALLVDDWPAAADGARAVGMAAIVFESNAQTIAAVEAALRSG